jgi:hypothetical protein
MLKTFQVCPLCKVYHERKVEVCTVCGYREEK